MIKSNTWTEEDCERLRAHVERGGSASRASVMFKRSTATVKSRARKLGVPFPYLHVLRRQRLAKADEVERKR